MFTWIQRFEDGIVKHFIWLWLFYFHQFTEIERFSHKVPDKLHEFVYSVFVDKWPLFIQVCIKSFIESKPVFSLLLRNGEWKLRDSGGEIMLIDHFIEVPEAVEEGLDNIGEGDVIKIGGGDICK